MIYLVRHGQSVSNVARVFSGRTDVLLTQEGIEQANQAGEALKDVKLDLCFSSPLKRAKHTAEQILKHHPNVTLKIEPLLIERSYGELENKPFDEIKFDRWKFNQTPPHKDFESLEEMIERVNTFLETLAPHKDKNILIVSHSAVTKAIQYCITKQEIETIGKSKVKNATPIALEF